MGRSPAFRLPALLLACGVALLSERPAAAQNHGLVVRDDTLGSGPLEVGPGSDPLGQPATYLITPEMGEQSGSNLFHSFARFDVGVEETATFTGPDPIDGPQSVSNVISRVTGGDPSEIDGTLRSTIPGADLWLLNPSGVMFGEGASLDVPGSFHASTGDYVGFGEGNLERYYGDPSRPSVLSTAAPAAFGFLSESTPAPLSVTGARLATVRAGDGIEFTGGDAALTSATLDAPGGAVSIRGGQIVIEESSRVLAENAGDEAAGTITVEASESVLIDNSLLSVSTHSAGDAGTIRVEGPEISFQNGPGFLDVSDFENNVPRATEVGASAETSSGGAGGTIEIDTGSLTVTNGASVSARSFGLGATGHAGNIDISADSVHVSARSDVTAGAWNSQGNGGDIDIEAGTLEVDGAEDYAFISTSSAGPSFGFLKAEVSVPGAPGVVEIGARVIELRNGGLIESACYGCTSKREHRAPAAGTVEIRGESMVLDGVNALNESWVGVATIGGAGDGGTLQIDLTDSLKLLRGGGLGAATLEGSGDAGAIRIHADSVLISGMARLQNGILAAGIRVRSQTSTGNAGTIDLTARTLEIEAGGLINANSLTIPVGVDADPGGDAGTIRVTASESISVSNEGGEVFSLSRVLLGGLFPNVEPLVGTGITAATVFGGQGGSITLEAPEITVSHGALVGSSTVGGGDAGSVLLQGDNLHILEGGNVSSASLRLLGTIPGGKGGDVQLAAGESIEVAGADPDPEATGRSNVTSSTLGAGPAGSVTLRAPRIVVEDGGIVQTTAIRQQGQGLGNARGGDITLDAAAEVIVRGGGLVDASSFVPERAGDVVVTAAESIEVDGEGSRIESRTGGPGAGGNVVLRAPRIDIADGGVVSARSAPGYQGVAFAILEKDDLVAPAPTRAKGDAGALSLDAEQVLLFGGTLATNATDEDAADGGDIAIEARELVHLDAGEITASVNGGSGGNITIDPEVVILQNGSRIVAQAAGGSGGNIEINADNYFAFPGTEVSAEADRQELSGTVEVSTPDVNLAGTLAALPTSYLDAASLMKAPCAARRSGERAGSFAVRAHDGMPPEPDGWLPATLASEPTATTATRPTPPASRATSLSSPARLDGCR